MVLKALQFFQSGFEGCEKKLEIDFQPIADLRKIQRSTWEEILEEACCSIISTEENDYCTAYLLSESSLFVYQHKMMIKTCGTTGLLHIISKLLIAADAIGTKPEFVQYSRSNFLFPSEQPYPHQSFQMEVDYLNTFFSGSAYILGPLDGPRWHLYVADMNLPLDSSDQTLEVVMFDLPESVTSLFFRSSLEKKFGKEVSSILDENPSEFGSKNLGSMMTKISGIDGIVEGMTIDDFMFDPCGYSCNAINGSSYYTIHITPEPECSFVSFDTNLPVTSYSRILETILGIFQPGRFCVCVFVDEGSPVSDSQQALSWDLPNYLRTERSFYRFAGKYNVTCANFSIKEKSASKVSAEASLASLNLQATPEFEKVTYDQFCRIPESHRVAIATKSIGKMISLHKHLESEFSDHGSLIMDAVSKRMKMDPFFVVDFGTILKKMSFWSVNFPLIRPFYNSKCNGDSSILSMLNSFGCGFTCVSVAEIKHLLDAGVDGKDIFFNRPFKTTTQLKFARDCGIGYMSFDNVSELETIVKIHPDVKLLLRTSLPQKSPIVSCVGKGPSSKSIMRPGQVSKLSVKHRYGCDISLIPELLSRAVSLSANVVGISSHIKKTISDEEDFFSDVKELASIYKIARSIVGEQFKFVDLDCEFIDWDINTNFSGLFLSPLVERLSLLFGPEAQLLAQPSKFLVTASHTLVVNVIGRRSLRRESYNSNVKMLESAPSCFNKNEDDDELQFLYYVNDGLYGSFNCLVYENHSISPIPLQPCDAETARYRCTIFGPTCDGIDIIAEKEYLPMLEVGDWLYFKDMGSFTVASSSAFNGFDIPRSHYIFSI